MISPRSVAAYGTDFNASFAAVPICFCLVRFKHGNCVYAASFIGDNERTTPEERYMEYMRILLTEIAVVHSLLEEIDPAFVVCHKFDLSEDSEQASKVAEFVSPNEAISQLLADSMVEQARGYNHVDLASPFEGAENVTARLQRKLDVLDARYC